MSSASKNIFWLTVSRIAALALLFLAYTRLFRYLGPFATGQYQSALSYVTLFGVIIDFGLQQYIIKKISEEPQRVKTYFHNFLATEIVLAILIYTALLIVAKVTYEPVVFYTIAVAGLGTMINGLTYPFLSVLSAFQDLKKVALINFLNSLVNVAVIFAVVIFHKYIVFLASNQLIFGLVGLLIYNQYIKRYIPKPEILRAIRSLDFGLLKNIFKAAFPFALLVGFSTIYNRIDVLLISKILGYEQAGLYTAAYKFFDLIAFFPAVVSHSLYPLFTSDMARGLIAAVKENLEKYLRFLIALALPMGVGGSILAKQLIIILAGPQFASSAPVLAILVWAPVTLFIYIVGNALVISQLTKFAVLITGSNVFVNIIGNLILLPRIGIRGAAIMTVVSELVQGIFYFYFVRKKITAFRLFGQFWQPAIAPLLMGA